MMPGASFFAPWYYHLPNLILAALIWLLIGRLVLSLVLGRGNAVVRLIEAVTSPVVQAVGAITPRLVPAGLVIVFAIAWLLAARIALFVAVSATGVRLSMG
jgi:YggT family protein